MIARRRPCRILAAAAPLWLCGCANTVFPPQHATDPVQVGILDHGQHTSLIVEIPGAGMRRYSYGDWQWYALRQTGPLEGTSALFWPSEAALGRKDLPGPFSPTAVALEVRVPIEHALYLTVDAHAVRGLTGRLDRIYDANFAERIDNEAYDLVFVPYPEPYWIFHNSNQVVAGWLEQLQCRVAGPALFAVWRLGAGAKEAPRRAQLAPRLSRWRRSSGQGPSAAFRSRRNGPERCSYFHGGIT